MTEDFYDLLDVAPDASRDEIREAYRRKVRVYHPDLNEDDRARAQFTVLKKAYDTLEDPVERRAYDRLGHETYVAKRTSGIPAPGVWSDRDDATDGASSPSSVDSSADETAESDSGGGDARGNDARGPSGGTAAETDGTAGATAGGAGNGTTANRATASATVGGTATSATRGGGTRSAGRTRSQRSRDRDDSAARLSENPVARWWRRRNFAWPLLWWAVFTYVGGLAHFAVENAAAIRLFRTALEAAGADLEALRSVLGAGRYGVERPAAFVSRIELVAPPLETAQWYAALAGVVATTLLLLLVLRLTRRPDAWGGVTINETIAVALTATVVATLVGGPLLAGALLLPLLFGVIVYRTRQLAGWSPSYLYVLAVSTPLVGFGLSAADASTLATDLLLFGLVPLLGAFGLPLRTVVRRRYGR